MLETKLPVQTVANARCRNGRNGEILVGRVALVTHQGYRGGGPGRPWLPPWSGTGYAGSHGQTPRAHRAPVAPRPLPGRPPRRLDRRRPGRPERHGVPALALE